MPPQDVVAGEDIRGVRGIPAGTLRGGGQGCDLVIAVGDHFPLSTRFPPPGMLRVSSLGGGLGRAGPHVGRGPPQDDSVFFGLVGVVWVWVVPLAGYPAGGGTFLFRQESTQRRGLLGRRWGRAFLAWRSRGLGGPSRSRPPLRTPPGTLRVSLQGESLGRAGPHVGRGPPQDDSVFFWL